MVKPKKLKPGSKIGIVSPSYWLNKDDLKKSHSQNWHRNVVGVSKSFRSWSKQCFGKEQKI